MSGMIADLAVAGRLAARAISRRLGSRVEPPPDLDAFTRELEALVAKAPDTAVCDHCWLHLPATQAPWVDSGMALEEGDEVTYFIGGRVYANRFLDIYVSPALICGTSVPLKFTGANEAVMARPYACCERGLPRGQ